MSAPSKSRLAKPAFDLVEEATQLLRRAPVGVLLSYYIGTLPAVLGLLYFFTDMSYGAFARAHLMHSSLVAALLYLWMKCWQAVFASGLTSSLRLEPPAPWTASRIARLILIQCAIQPTGLFVRLIAAQFLFPYLWVYGFYQNVGVLGTGEESPGGGVREVIRRSFSQALLWPLQAHGALTMVCVFGLFVAANLGVAIVMAPQLLQSCFGIETVFSRSPMALLNTTVGLVICGLTYLAFDPLRKAIYVLRCFYGTTRSSGDDLRIELKRIRAASAKAALVLAVLLGFWSATPGFAGEPPAAQSAPAQLDSSIERVLERPEYSWRQPRERAAENQKGWLTSSVEEFFHSLGDIWKQARKGVEDFQDKLKAWLGVDKDADGSDASGWGLQESVKPLLYAVTAILCVVLGGLLVRLRRSRRPRRWPSPRICTLPICWPINGPKRGG
jgi:hypothetical protein